MSHQAWLAKHLQVFSLFPICPSVQIESLNLGSVSKEPVPDKISNDFPVPKSTPQ